MINLNSKNKYMKNIITKNYKGEYHGYHEYYYFDGLGYRANYKNNKLIAYEEYHRGKRTTYYIR